MKKCLEISSQQATYHIIPNLYLLDVLHTYQPAYNKVPNQRFPVSRKKHGFMWVLSHVIANEITSRHQSMEYYPLVRSRILLPLTSLNAPLQKLCPDKHL